MPLQSCRHTACELCRDWPGGKTLGLVSGLDAGSTPRRFGSPFSSKVVIYGHCLVIVPCTFKETLTMAKMAAHLNPEIILVLTV